MKNNKLMAIHLALLVVSLCHLLPLSRACIIIIIRGADRQADLGEYNKFRDGIRNITDKLKDTLSNNNEQGLLEELNGIQNKLTRFDETFTQKMGQLSRQFPNELGDELGNYDHLKQKFETQLSKIKSLGPSIQALEQAVVSGHEDNRQLLSKLSATADNYFEGVDQLMSQTDVLLDDTSKRLASIKSVSEEVHSQIGSIALVQQRELQRMGELNRDVVKLKEQALQLLENPGDRAKLKANILKNSTRHLKEFLEARYEQISKRLDHVISQQQRLELVLLFSKAANRIEYLAEMRQQLRIKLNPMTGLYEPEDKAGEWAQAVIYGEPSDQRISDLMEDINVLIRGDESASPIDVSIPEKSILLLYEDAIKEFVEQRKHETRKWSKPWSKQSAAFYMKLFTEEVFQLQVLGYTLEWQARNILQGTRIMQDKRDISNDFYDDLPSKKNCKDEDALCISPISVRRRRAAEDNCRECLALEKWRKRLVATHADQAKLMKKAVDRLSESCPNQMHRHGIVRNSNSYNTETLIFKQSVIDTARLEAARNNIGKHRVIGCQLEANNGNNYIVPKCRFRKVTSTNQLDHICGEPDDVIFPESFGEQLNTAVPSSQTSRATSVLTGSHHVSNIANETICGIRMTVIVPTKKLNTSNEPPFVALGVEICSRKTGEKLRFMEPDVTNKNAIKPFTHINTHWVCPSPVGSVTGIGLNVNNLGEDEILELSFQSVF